MRNMASCLFSNPFRRTASDDNPDLVDDDEGLVDDADSSGRAYELHEWASETRAMLAQLLIADQVLILRGKALPVSTSRSRRLSMP